jgi:hypothetical protein
MTQRAEALRARSAALTKVAEATAPLYGSLDETQKRRFDILTQASHLAPFARPGRRAMETMPHRWQGRWQHHWQDHGPRDGDRSFYRSWRDRRDDDGDTRSPARHRPTAPDDEDNL